MWIFSGTLLGSVAFDGVEVGLGVYTSSWGRALAAVQPPVTGWTKCWTPHMEPPKDWKDNVAELLFRSMSVSAQLCHVNIKHVSNIEPKPPWLSWRSLHFCLFKHFWSTAVSPGCRPQGPLGKPQLARPMLRRKTLWSRTKVKKVKIDECSFEAQLGFWWSRDFDFFDVQESLKLSCTHLETLTFSTEWDNLVLNSIFETSKGTKRCTLCRFRCEEM